MIRIHDPTWCQLDEDIHFNIKITWRELDGKRLEFRTGFRPEAQYFFFHYCVQLLHRSWQYDGLSTTVLEEEVDKNLWNLPGSFLPRNMLLAFMEELGSSYESLLQGTRHSIYQFEDPYVLLNVCVRHIFGWQCRPILSDSDFSKVTVWGGCEMTIPFSCMLFYPPCIFNYYINGFCSVNLSHSFIQFHPNSVHS